MFPSVLNSAHPATTLWQVERDGNPLRQFGHVSPFIGKLGALDKPALDQIGQLARAALPALPGTTLVIGMTESSLLLSFFLSLWQQKPVDLRFTSRKIRTSDTHRIAFREPHSHGPQHYLALDEGVKYSQIVVVEDELTTGATLRNLLLALEGTAPRVFVITLRDLRTEQLREKLQNEMHARGVKLNVLSLDSFVDEVPDEITPLRPCFNPFGRDEIDRLRALDELEKQWREFRFGTVWIIGECVDIALGWWLELPIDERPQMRQITRSPWKIDGQSVFTAQKLEAEGQASRYFIYNFEPPHNNRVLWMAEKCNASVGLLASEFFASQNIEARGIEVAGT